MMEILLATVEDAPALLALQRLAYRSEAERYDDFSIPPLTETLEALQADFGRKVFLKVVVESQLVGAVRAFQQGETCHVERLVVHPDHQGHGIGTALLRRIELQFPAARRWELFTGHQSVNNLHLYERLGYREFKRERVHDELTLVFLEKLA